MKLSASEKYAYIYTKNMMNFLNNYYKAEPVLRLSGRTERGRASRPDQALLDQAGMPPGAAAIAKKQNRA